MAIFIYIGEDKVEEVHHLNAKWWGHVPVCLQKFLPQSQTGPWESFDSTKMCFILPVESLVVPRIANCYRQQGMRTCVWINILWEEASVEI